MHATCRRRSNGRGSLRACSHRASRPDRRIAPLPEVCVRSAYTLCRAHQDCVDDDPKGRRRHLRTDRHRVGRPVLTRLQAFLAPGRPSERGSHLRPDHLLADTPETGAARPAAGWRDPASRAWWPPQFTGRQQLLTHKYDGRRLPRTRGHKNLQSPPGSGALFIASSQDAVHQLARDAEQPGDLEVRPPLGSQ